MSRFTKLAVWTAALGAVAGCSLINSFGEVRDVDGTGGGGGMGGSTGGSSSGGASTGGGGGEGPTEVDPGLVVVLGNLDGDVGQPVLLALSPQTGEQLAVREGFYAAAVHESERDIWFLFLDGEVRAARFDRRSNEWEDLGQAAEASTPTDPRRAFAVNGYLAVVNALDELRIYDTRDLGDIQPIEHEDGEDPPVGFWGGVGVPSESGGNLYVLYRDSAGDGDIAVQRFVISEEGVEVIPALDVTTPDGDSSTLSAGALVYDAGARQPIAVLPSMTNTQDHATAWPVSLNSIGDEFQIDNVSFQPRAAAIDPCQSVVYVTGPGSTSLRARGLASNGGQLEQNVAINANEMVYEPFTQSLLLVQQSGEDFRLDAWEVDGTTEEPALSKRQGDWDPPSIRARFTGVAIPENISCD